MSLKKYKKLFKEAGKGWKEDKAEQLSSSLAFYTAISLGPFLFITVSFTSLIFGHEAATQKIIFTLSQLVGDKAGQAIKDVLDHSYQSGSNILTAILGLIMLFFGAEKVFGGLQNTLNIIWKVEVKPQKGFWRALHRLFFSTGTLVGAMFLLLISSIATTGILSLENYLFNHLPDGTPRLLLQITDFIFNFTIMTVLFAIIYKFLPNIKIHWSDVWIGSIITTSLFESARFLIANLLKFFRTEEAFGAASSFVVVLFWVYFSTQIILYGAELAKSYTKYFGSGSRPDKDGVKIKKEKIKNK